MHSSQNEQDSRFYAEMARVPCLEPTTQQEAYDMTREAFELSERFRTPVMVRLVTRLCHSRTAVETRPPTPRRSRSRPSDPSDWTLLPSNARRRWRVVLERQGAIERLLADSAHTALTVRPGARLGVVTAGLGRNYFLEALPELAEKPSHLHVGAYPEPEEKLRRLAESVDRLLVLEEGRPILEQRLRGVVRPGAEVIGRMSGHLPADGELTPDLVSRALGLPERPHLTLTEGEDPKLPARPPQLCTGCPHRDSFTALRQALDGRSDALVTGDIGCYTLGALPPFRAIDSCVCMGASIGMAKGAADAGTHPVVAVIGDSTFLHSGIQPLLDAATADTDMTLLILDNGAVGMTGAQDTVAPSSLFEPLALGLGVHPDHCVVVDAHPRKIDEMTEVLRRELDHRGLSVVIAVRECIEHARKRKKEVRA
jgi:indolepyruvate ferredoxin oxidoreductase alpha subunit